MERIYEEAVFNAEKKKIEDEKRQEAATKEAAPEVHPCKVLITKE